jgi:hypothetical protein
MEERMKSKYDLFHSLSLVMIVAVLIGGCDFSKVRIGEVRVMVGSNEDGHISYNYSTFTGFENGSAQVEAGGRISFDYRVTVTKGSLLIEWQDPNGEVVWRENLQESENGEGIIDAEISGAYQVIIRGRDAGGDFDIAWYAD